MTMRSKQEQERLAELDQRNVSAIIEKAIYNLAQLEKSNESSNLIDLYSERNQKTPEIFGESDSKTQNGLIDKYSERMKRKRRK